MSFFKSILGSALVLALLATQSQADIIAPLLPVSASSEFADADNIANGSGLSGVGPVEDQLHNNDENSMWQTAVADSVGETIDFDLGGIYNLSNALIWQYNGPNGFGLAEPDREIMEFELAVSPDLSDSFTSIGTFNLAASQDQLAAGFNEPAQVFALSGATAVREVRLTINSVHGGVSDGAAGLSEVRFEGTLVPEPTTIVLGAASALALLGIRRRR